MTRVMHDVRYFRVGVYGQSAPTPDQARQLEQHIEQALEGRLKVRVGLSQGHISWFRMYLDWLGSTTPNELLFLKVVAAMCEELDLNIDDVQIELDRRPPAQQFNVPSGLAASSR